MTSLVRQGAEWASNLLRPPLEINHVDPQYTERPRPAIYLTPSAYDQADGYVQRLEIGESALTLIQTALDDPELTEQDFRFIFHTAEDDPDDLASAPAYATMIDMEEDRQPEAKVAPIKIIIYAGSWSQKDLEAGFYVGLERARHEKIHHDKILGGCMVGMAAVAETVSLATASPALAAGVGALSLAALIHWRHKHHALINAESRLPRTSSPLFVTHQRD